MPSGSHSSGGSHFGGGSFGGHHSSGSHFSSSHGPRSMGFYPRTPRVMMFFGHRVYLSSHRASAMSLLSGLLIFAIVVCFFGGIAWFGTQKDISTIEQQHALYCAMVERAQGDDNYRVTGKVTDYDFYEGGDVRYCIFYTFETAYGACHGNSYFVYSRQQALAMQGKTIDLATAQPQDKLTPDSDSTPMDYIDIPLTDDAEYQDRQQSLTIFRLITLVGVGAVVTIIVVMVAVPATAQRATAEQVAASQTKTSSTSTEQTTTKIWRCEYCGSANPDHQTTCSGCGAGRKNV